MKTSYHKTAVAALVALCLCLPACVDDGYNLDNLSGDVQWNGSLALPVLANSKVTIGQLIDAYPLNEDAAIDLFVGTDGTLTLQAGTEASSLMPDINKNFSEFDDLIKDLVILDAANGIAINNVGGTYTVPTPCDLYQKVNVDAVDAENKPIHRINRIEFENTGITLELTIDKIDFETLTAEIELPQDGAAPAILSFPVPQPQGGVATHTLNNQNFTVDLKALHAAGDQLNIRLTGDGIDVGSNASITASLSLDHTNGDFTAYGYFNYQQLLVDDAEKERGYPVPFGDLSKYINADFLETVFDFGITSGFGVPVLVKIEKIATFKEGVSLSDVNPNREYEIGSATNNGQTTTSSHQVGKDILGNIISTNIDSIALKYSVRTMEITDFDVAETTMPEQFISSKNALGINVSSTIPLDFYARTIAYRDTMELDLSDIETLDAEKIALIFTYNNGLPLSVQANLWLAENTDANGNYIATTVEPYESSIKLKNTKTEERFVLEFDKNKFDNLKRTKALIMEYYADNLPANIIIKDSDYLGLKVGVQVKKITYKP